MTHLDTGRLHPGSQRHQIGMAGEIIPEFPGDFRRNQQPGRRRGADSGRSRIGGFDPGHHPTLARAPPPDAPWQTYADDWKLDGVGGGRAISVRISGLTEKRLRGFDKEELAVADGRGASS